LGTLLHGWCDALDNSKPSVGEGESEVLGFLRTYVTTWTAPSKLE